MKTVIRFLLTLLFLPLFLLITTRSPMAFEGLYCQSGISSELSSISRGDSTGESPHKTGWTMEELKEVLSNETGGRGEEELDWKDKKNARVAMLCALIFPGLGQMYNERPVKAALAMGLETWYLTTILLNYRQEKREKKIRDSYDKWIESDTGDNYISSSWRYHNAWYNEYKARKIDWLWWSSGILVILIFDAYVDAHLHGMDFKVESVSIEQTPGFQISIDF